ncbi:transcriptional regulator family: Fungal Specific TF [Penicillium hispanicum]|uniref:transcriptional regulator family: Fungal Specific TF n=1 Tax=Penicillium hispanicum TaxID=1080232 RepID=UPI0025411463|nr:transcriptional regulator family: Fungal Specific TF [Penicillium hispanicum]KAJ5569535.1 transcriptional regulator family: Fungal Specific TF [Penicillium hispanicum]
MVYGGKPSTGCHLCRKRKIKCDEARPGCRNCAVYGRPCPGYRPNAVFRHETSKVQWQAKRDVSTSSAVSRQTLTPPADSSDVVEIQRVSPARSSPLTLHALADATWEQRALCYFFDQYTINGQNEDGMGHLEYLPSLYVENDGAGEALSPSSCLRWAVDATALITLANASHAPPLMIKARQGYGKALRILREVLASPTEAVKDETFASVILLSLFEDISGERKGLYSSHTAGFEFLMRSRGVRQLAHQRGREMFGFAFTHTYVEILALGDKPRCDLDWVLAVLRNNDPVERLMLAACKLSQLFVTMQSASTSPDQATVKSWIAAGQQCDFELSQWTLHLPDRWLPLVVYSSHGEQLITYNRISNAVIWNYYRAVRVMVQQLLLNLNRTLNVIIQKNKKFGEPPVTKSTLDESGLRAIIQEMTADLCRSIPFALSDIDTLGRSMSSTESQRPIRAAQGYGLLWPLWYILTCGMPTPAQVNQIRSVLYRIGTTMGINLALVLGREAERLPNDPNSYRAPTIGGHADDQT